MPPDMLALHNSFKGKIYLLTDHASKRAAQRDITSGEIEEAVLTGEVIEDYPDDKYGPSCLIYGETQNNRILHVQVSYPPNVKVITVYEPFPDEWDETFKERR